jgi:hypothetical protein
MTQLKFESKTSAAANEAIEAWIRPLYDNPGKRIMFIGELAPTERTEPAPGSEKVPVVKVRITSLEIPADDQAGFVRLAQRALYLQRTARGTLQEDGQLEFAPDTLRLAAGQIHAVGFARLKSHLAHWERYVHRLTYGPDLTASEWKHELDIVRQGLAAALSPVGDDTDRD